MLADAGLKLAEGLFALLARTSLPENMASCLNLVSVIIELLGEQAAPLLHPIATTVERVDPTPPQKTGFYASIQLQWSGCCRQRCVIGGACARCRQACCSLAWS